MCPPGRGPFRVVYLLHGLGTDLEIWRAYDVEPLAAARRLMVVMPDGDNSYYVNDRRPGGLGAWEDAIVRDVRGTVDRMFRTVPLREGRGVAGISMGGFGAMMLALRHPRLFGACACLSGSLYFGHAPHPRGEAWQDALARGLPKGDYDVFELARRLAEGGGVRPAVWMACGTGDGHFDDHRRLSALLDRWGWSHVFEQGTGTHDTDFWREHLPLAFDFLASTLSAGGRSDRSERDGGPTLE